MSFVQKLRSNNSEESYSTGDRSLSAAQKKLTEFIAEDPNSRYTFDSERDAQDSDICREGKEKSRKCIRLHMHSTQMFKAMQDQGFFCRLPMDPTRTHMECMRIPNN